MFCKPLMRKKLKLMLILRTKLRSGSSRLMTDDAALNYFLTMNKANCNNSHGKDNKNP